MASIPDARGLSNPAKAGSYNSSGKAALLFQTEIVSQLDPILVIPSPTRYASAADNVERTHLVLAGGAAWA